MRQNSEELQRQIRQRVRERMDLSRELTDEEAVSYTHLDVYKRQELVIMVTSF